MLFGSTPAVSSNCLSKKRTDCKCSSCNCGCIFAINAGVIETSHWSKQRSPVPTSRSSICTVRYDYPLSIKIFQYIRKLRHAAGGGNEVPNNLFFWTGCLRLPGMMKGRFLS